MELNHLQFIYDEPQDRLLLRIAATDDGTQHELRAWLTRRFIASLWVAVQKALAMQVTLAHPAASHASAELIEMAHQFALDKLTEHGAFGDNFRNDLPPHAALANPFLVAEAKFHIAAQEPMRVNFLPAEGLGIEIAFNDVELHGFCTLLQQAVMTAQWDVPLQLESAWDDASHEHGETGFDMPLQVAPRLLN